MKYESAELLDRLTAEYVLGTLRGAARRRLERLCMTNSTARRLVNRWEDDFAALSRSLVPLQPSPRVWAGVQRQLADAESPARFIRRRSRTWQFAAAAGLVAVVLVVGLFVRQPFAPLQTVAVLGTDATHPLWRVERPAKLTRLTIRVVGPVQVASQKAYELWALPRGGKPVSLGVLPESGVLERDLSESQRVALLTADKVAVSIEPAGGSPIGSPTGTIVIVASVPVSG